MENGAFCSQFCILENFAILNTFALELYIRFRFILWMYIFFELVTNNGIKFRTLMGLYKTPLTFGDHTMDQNLEHSHSNVFVIFIN
jgi:hypothetical protein